MRIFTSDTEIEHIGLGLIHRNLPKPEWTHAAHFAAASWLLSRGEREAFARLPGLIRAYNEATGVANTDAGGYHETITLASLRAARAWLAAHRGLALFEAVNALLAGECGRSEWPLQYWSRTLLFSVGARRAWVPPDLKPLPFA